MRTQEHACVDREVESPNCCHDRLPSVEYSLHIKQVRSSRWCLTRPCVFVIQFSPYDRSHPICSAVIATCCCERPSLTCLPQAAGPTFCSAAIATCCYDRTRLPSNITKDNKALLPSPHAAVTGPASPAASQKAARLSRPHRPLGGAPHRPPHRRAGRPTAASPGQPRWT